LKGKHGADLSAVKNIEKKGLDDIVLVMAKGNLVALETMSKMKEAFPPVPGAEEAWVLPILGAIRSPPDIGELDMVREPHVFKKLLQDASPPGIEAEVNVNRHEFVMDGDAFAPLIEKVEQGQAILSAGNPHQNAVSPLDQTITVDRFSHQASDLFLPISHFNRARGFWGSRVRVYTELVLLQPYSEFNVVLIPCHFT